MEASRSAISHTVSSVLLRNLLWRFYEPAKKVERRRNQQRVGWPVIWFWNRLWIGSNAKRAPSFGRALGFGALRERVHAGGNRHSVDRPEDQHPHDGLHQ